LRSRISFHVPFADYSREELYSIAELVAHSEGRKLDAGCKKKINYIVREAMRTSSFGNGRFMRNLVEKAMMNQAGRLVAMDAAAITKRDVERLLPQDFEAPKMLGAVKQQTGFAR
jgi:hypothetical protein